MGKFILVISIFISLFLLKFSAVAQINQTVANGDATTAVNFSGAGCTYNWVNNTPGIGLTATGKGDISSFNAVNTTNSPITATITATPVRTGFAYITNGNDGTVSVINTITNKVVSTIKVGKSPFGVATSADGSRVYITNSQSNTVSVISTTTNTVLATISVGSNPMGITVSPDGSKVYVVNNSPNDDNGSVTVIDALTENVITMIVVGKQPEADVVSPNGNLLYVTNSYLGTVSVINTSTNAVINTIIPYVSQSLTGIAISPDGSLLYVVDEYAGSVNQINAATGAEISRMGVGNGATEVVLSPDGSKGYTVNSLNGNISVLDTKNGYTTATIDVGKDPYGLSLTPDGKELYITSTVSNTISVMNTATNTIVATIPVGAFPFAFGNFISSGQDCTSSPVTFTITVNPSLVTPAIIAGTVTGNISTCVGMASTSPDIEQFTVSASGLTGNITASAPNKFEVSLTATGGYSNSVVLPQTGGTINNTVIYVRSAAADPAGNISGNVTLTSSGATPQNIAVTGVVNALPTVNIVPNQLVLNGAPTTSVNFAGTGNTFNWVNNTPGIGLPASGTGDITSFNAINKGTTPVTATITATPVNAGFAYITNASSNSVSVINTGTHNVVSTISVGLEPWAAVVSSDGSRAYIINASQNSLNGISSRGTVSVINTLTNTVISTINVGVTPLNAVLSPDGSLLYVTNINDETISVISTNTNTVIKTVPMYTPDAIAISPDGKYLYITSNWGAKLVVYVVATADYSIVATIPTNSSTVSIAISPDGKFVYIPLLDADKVLVVDATTYEVVTTIPVGGNPYGISISPDGSKIYVTNSYTKNVSVINTATNTVISTITTPGYPYGISASPDGKEVYVANQNPDGVSVINTSTGQITSTINAGTSPLALGNFVTAGTGCAGVPVTFTITVNPNNPIITASNASGAIVACVGTASASPGIQQFTVLGTGLTNNITATAPPGFEVSLAESSGYGSSISVTQNGGKVDNTIIYVRSATADPAGSISGDVILSSAGATSEDVAVSGVVNALPVVNAVPNQTIADGASSPAISFTGTGNTYNWTNDTPGIGLPASGTGDIASFTAVNNGTTPIMATITIVPNGASCSGSPVTFTITVNPPLLPIISSGGTLSPLATIYGTPSASTSFTVSGTNMKAAITVTPPPGFEMSTDNVNFNSTVTVGAAGTVNAVPGYIRLAKTTFVGTYTGNIVLSSTGAGSINVNMPASTVTPAPLSITANNANKIYGEVLTSGPGSGDFTSAGLQNNETIGSVTITYGKGSAEGDEAITYTGSVIASAATSGTFTASNYSITYLPGDIVVAKAVLTVTANDQTKTYDTPNPVFLVTYLGFVNGDKAEQLIKQPDITTPATTTSPIGEYPIIPDGEKSNNYTFNNVDGVLTIRFTITIPNAFTPNGDGINDTWNIAALASYPKCLVNIYDRYGQLAYQSEGYSKPWDGTINGKIAPMGTYYYIINLRDGSKPSAGYVTLIH